MNTPSHFLMTAFARAFTLRKHPHKVLSRRSIFLGAVAPDLPLYFLSVGTYVYYVHIMGWPARSAFRYMFDTLYFENMVWIGLHNTLHAPLVVVTGLWISHLRSWRALYTFFLACALHSVVDILTHHNDGPVLFFPLDWQYRFASPVSYWDPAHYGQYFSVFESLLNLFFVGYLLWPLWQQWKPSR